MTTYVILLYSVTLGPGRRLIMSDLRELALELGYSNPRTVLATGNLVAEHSRASLASLTKQFEDAFAVRFGRRIDAIFCTAENWRVLLEDNPFTTQSVNDPSHVTVRVMRDALPEDTAQRLDPLRAQGEILCPVNGHVWAYFAKGIGNSKLAAAMTPKRMGGIGTTRNWNTVRKIATALDA